MTEPIFPELSFKTYCGHTISGGSLGNLKDKLDRYIGIQIAQKRPEEAQRARDKLKELGVE